LDTKVRLELALGLDVLNVSAILPDEFLLLHLDIRLLINIREAPLLADDDLLASRELIPGPPQRFRNNRRVILLRPNTQQNLADIDSRHGSVGFPPSSTHTGLKPISSSAGQHLVDANDVERVDSDSEMEGILSRGLGDVFVGADTGGFESFGGELFVFVRDHVDAEREIVNRGALPAQVEDADLGVWHTTIETRFRERFVLAITIATCWTTAHLDLSEGE